MAKIGRFKQRYNCDGVLTFIKEGEEDNMNVLTEFEINLKTKKVSRIREQKIVGMENGLNKIKTKYLDFTFDEIEQIYKLINENKKSLKWEDLNTYSKYLIKMDEHEYYLTMAHKNTLLNGNVNVYTLRFERVDTWEHINLEISDMECDQAFFNDLKLELLDTYKTEE